MSQQQTHNAILKVFLEESVELLAAWELALDSFEKSPKAEAAQPVLKTVSRLKGAAATVGIEALANFSGEVDDLVGFLQAKGIPSLLQATPFLRDCLNLFRAWFEGLKADPGHQLDLTKIRAALVKLNPAASIHKEKPKPQKAIGEILLEKKLVTPEQVDKAVALQERRLGQVMIDEGMISKDALDKTLKEQAKEPVAVKKVAEQIRVPASRIDSLLQIVGELSIHQSIIWHSRQTGNLHAKAAQNAILLSNKIIREVQSQVMSLRLQPLRSLFQRLERVARDVALSQGKRIETKIEGADVDLDKAVIEKITDPLIHIVRNGVDHGIEAPEDRLAGGKPEVATLRIAAMQDTGDVVLTIQDDGRGMDPKKIMAKAVEKGFVQPGAQMKPSEVYNLIFMPGFSTADKVTEFSGRGVGMDVVNRVIGELGGSIGIQSELGKGSTFSINIPTSVSLIDAVVFSVQDSRYVVPMRDLVEVVDLSNFRLESRPGGLMMSLRGEVVPVERLIEYLPGAEEAFPDSATASTPAGVSALVKRRPALLTRNEEGLIAFEVDAILGQQQIVVRALSDNMARIPGFVGGTILGDGEPGMIVGLSAIARNYFQRLRTGHAQGEVRT